MVTGMRVALFSVIALLTSTTARSNTMTLLFNDSADPIQVLLNGIEVTSLPLPYALTISGETATITGPGMGATLPSSANIYE